MSVTPFSASMAEPRSPEPKGAGSEPGRTVPRA